MDVPQGTAFGPVLLSYGINDFINFFSIHVLRMDKEKYICDVISTIN